MATVVMLGTLDTKGREYDWVRRRLREAGVEVLLVDAGVLGEPLAQPDISREDVARAGGHDARLLASAGDRGTAIEAMGEGAAAIARELHASGRLDCLMALGGSGGSVLAAAAFAALPVGVPKLLVSTLASGNVQPFVGTSDVTVMHSVVDVSGINRISERVLANAAGAAAGMAKTHAAFREGADVRPLVAATMFGVTTPCVTAARERLEDLGYEVVVFHATGSGGRTMERLVADGYFAGVLDATTTELADQLVGGVLTAGPDRLEAAGAAGLPQVVSLGALDMVNFGPKESVPTRFTGRTFHRHNAAVTLMRTTPEECAELGRIIARKLTAAAGPVTLFVPLRGISAIAVEGGVFHDPVADRALVDAIRAGVGPNVEIRAIDTDINDPAFARAMADALHEAIAAGRT